MTEVPVDAARFPVARIAGIDDDYFAEITREPECGAEPGRSAPNNRNVVFIRWHLGRGGASSIPCTLRPRRTTGGCAATSEFQFEACRDDPTIRVSRQSATNSNSRFNARGQLGPPRSKKLMMLVRSRVEARHRSE